MYGNPVGMAAVSQLSWLAYHKAQSAVLHRALREEPRKLLLPTPCLSPRLCPPQGRRRVHPSPTRRRGATWEPARATVRPPAKAATLPPSPRTRNRRSRQAQRRAVVAPAGADGNYAPSVGHTRSIRARPLALQAPSAVGVHRRGDVVNVDIVASWMSRRRERNACRVLGPELAFGSDHGPLRSHCVRGRYH